MKTFAQLRLSFGKVLMLAVLATPFVVSCYDDSEMREKLDILADKVSTIEEKLNSELLALHNMLNGKILISDVSKNVSTGVTTVTLTNGSTLELLPKTDLKSLVTYTNIGGECFWAYIDENGAKQEFKTADGELVPVLTDTPEVIVEDGDYYIVLAGMRYPLGGNSVFSDYEVITDEITGEVYAVTFTFGEDMKFSVTVDGACGFKFVIERGFGNPVIVDDYYVGYGQTASVKVDMRGVEDYVLQMPDGWRVKERTDVYTGEKYFDITAPSYAKVESNDAEADGYLKAVVVLQGGKATTSKIYLSTEPFVEFSSAYGKLNVSLYTGLERYFYGVCPADQFNEEEVFATVESLLEAYDYPAGYAQASEDLKNMSVAEVFGAEPVYGEEYVFWAIPLQYFASDDDAYYFLLENTFEYNVFKSTEVTFEISAVSVVDATINFTAKGVSSYYVGLVTAEDYFLDDVLHSLNNGFETPITDTPSYEGSVFGFADVEAEADTDYVVWFAEAHEEGYVYTKSDLIVCPFSTLPITAGGSVNVQAGEAECGALEIEVPLTAAKAGSVYYAFLKTATANQYKDDESRAKYLFDNGICVTEEAAVAKLSDFPSISPKVSTKYVLLAVAVDATGKYGAVYSQEYSTTTIPFNEIQVEVREVKNAPGDVQLAISAEGASEYLYWMGRTDDNFFKSGNFLGADAAKAEVYMFLNSTRSEFRTAMETYPIVNGVLSTDKLELGVEYALVILTKDASGTFSHAALYRFIALAKNLGTIVLKSDSKWTSLVNEVKVDWIQELFEAGTGNMLGRYGFNLTVPAGYTAYVVPGSIYYYDYALTGTSIGEQIVTIMDEADHLCEADMIVDHTKEFPYDSEFYRFPHGSPYLGNNPGYAIIWSSQEFHDKACAGHEVKTEGVVNGITVPYSTYIYINDGNPVKFFPAGNGSTTQIVDQLYIVLQDENFNCYEPYVVDVPLEYFVNSKQ